MKQVHPGTQITFIQYSQVSKETTKTNNVDTDIIKMRSLVMNGEEFEWEMNEKVFQ